MLPSGWELQTTSATEFQHFAKMSQPVYHWTSARPGLMVASSTSTFDPTSHNGRRVPRHQMWTFRSFTQASGCMDQVPKLPPHWEERFSREGKAFRGAHTTSWDEGGLQVLLSRHRNVGQCISDLRSGKFVVQCTSVRWQFETSQQFRKASCGGSSHVSHVLLELWELSSCLARSTTLASSMAGPSGTGPRLSLCHHARLAVLQNYSFGSCRKIAGHRLQWSIVSWSTHDRSRMLTTSWHVQGDSGPQGQAVLAALCWS